MSSNEVSIKLFNCVPRLMGLMRSEVRKHSRADLSIPQFRVLANINRGVNQVGSISEVHGVSQPAMTKIIKSLEERKFISRKQSSLDKRASDLFLTKKGKDKFETIRNASLESLSIKLDSLTQAQRKEISSAFDTVERFLAQISGENQ